MKEEHPNSWGDMLYGVLWTGIMLGVGVVITTVLLVMFGGCTTRGGFPRFLRPGEPSDRALAKEAEQRQAIKVELAQKLEKRVTEIIDLESLGKELAEKYGGWIAVHACWDYWSANTGNADSSKVCDVIWLQSQGSRTRDIAWLLCYQAQWLPKPK